MHKFSGLLSVLILFAFSSVCAAQTGAGEAATSPDSASQPAMPEIITFESTTGNVRFPHNLHVDDMRLGCIACHHQIHATALETPHPEYLESSWVSCLGCHDSAPGVEGSYYKCADCHHSEPENIADETLSSKVVTHKSCWKCHRAGTGIRASEGCGDCHVKAEELPTESP